jgi:hypothetical protein
VSDGVRRWIGLDWIEEECEECGEREGGEVRGGERRGERRGRRGRREKRGGSREGGGVINRTGGWVLPNL